MLHSSFRLKHLRFPLALKLLERYKVLFLVLADPRTKGAVEQKKEESYPFFSQRQEEELRRKHFLFSVNLQAHLSLQGLDIQKEPSREFPNHKDAGFEK